MCCCCFVCLYSKEELHLAQIVLNVRKNHKEYAKNNSETKDVEECMHV